MRTRLLLLASTLLLVASTSAQGQTVIAGTDPVTGDGVPDGWTNILYVNEETPFDFSGTGSNQGVLTYFNFWVAGQQASAGLVTPVVVEATFDPPEFGTDFIVRAIGTTRVGATDWACGGLYSFPFHDTDTFSVQDGWFAGFLTSDPEGLREDAASPIPFVADANVQGWLTGNSAPVVGAPTIALDDTIIEGGSGTNVDAYGFRRYQFQVQAQPGGTLPELDPGGRVEGPCPQPIPHPGNIAGTHPVLGDGSSDSWTNVLYINEEKPFDFTEFGITEAPLKEFSFWADAGRLTDAVVTPFVAEPLVEDPQTGDDFIVRAIGTTREAGLDWEEAGLQTFPFHDSEELIVQNGWVAGFVTSDPLGELETTASPIPFVGNANIQGWLTGTSTAGQLAPAIELDQPILEGGSGTNVDAYGLRRYQFQISAEGGPQTPGDFNGDGELGLADIDLLGVEIAGGQNNASFDLTSDGLVDTDDLNAFLGLANKLNGDADFDGEVQFPDFVVLADNFGMPDRVWSQGDFDVNRETQFPDFVILANNFGQAAPANAPAVPEPATASLAALGMALILISGFRRSAR